MIRINWNPLPHRGPLPVNWYGLNWVVALVVGFILVRRWSDQWPELRTNLESLFIWITAGSAAGARMYYVVQNEPWEYFSHPLRILAVWEGGLGYFGGLFGGILEAYLWTRRHGFRLFESRGPVRTCDCDCIRHGTYKLLACRHGLWNAYEAAVGNCLSQSKQFRASRRHCSSSRASVRTDWADNWPRPNDGDVNCPTAWRSGRT